MSLYSFDFFSSFWSFLYWYISYILYLIINYSKHYLWSNTKLYFQSPSFPVIDFHRKEGTRGSFVLGPGRLAGKYRDDGLGWKSSKLQTWVPSGNNWEIRHVEKSTQTPIPHTQHKTTPIPVMTSISVHLHTYKHTVDRGTRQVFARNTLL